MFRYGFLDESQNKLDYVLSLTAQDVLERRLQVRTVVWRGGGRWASLGGVWCGGGVAAVAVSGIRGVGGGAGRGWPVFMS